MNTLIIGFGNIGKHLSEEIQVLNPSIVDRYKGLNSGYDKGILYDIAFVCVDTPKTDKSLCDITEVKNSLEEYDAKVYVIKSTVLPDSVKILGNTSNKRVVFSPEFYGVTQHGLKNQDFTILGGDIKDTSYVQQILQRVYRTTHRFLHVDSIEASLVKYMVNSFLAMKVSFCGQFWKIAKSLGISYERLRELFILDPRVGDSHTFIDNEKPYWKSHCFDKDVPAIAETYNAELLKGMLSFNETMKETNQ